MIFDGNSVIDNININLGTYKNVGLFEGSPNPYTFPGPNGENWSGSYTTPDVNYEYFEYENIKGDD